MTKDQLAEIGVALEARALPAPGAGLLLGIGRSLADLCAAFALQLARDCRWRAIQSCGDLADRLPGLEKLGNRASLVKAELTIMASHGSTLTDVALRL